MKQNSNTIIECPNCKAQYLPQEIFLSLFNSKCKYIRDTDTNQISFIDNPMDCYESYVCDFCGKPFNVQAKISFSSSIDSKFDFTESYKTKFTTSKLFLDES